MFLYLISFGEGKFMFKMSLYKNYKPIFSRNDFSLEEKFLQMFANDIKPNLIILLLGINQKTVFELYNKNKEKFADKKFHFFISDEESRQKMELMLRESLKNSQRMGDKLVSSQMIAPNHISSHFTDPLKEGLKDFKFVLRTRSSKESSVATINSSMLAFTQAIKFNLNPGHAIIALGFCYSMIGKYKVAFELFSYTKQIFPGIYKEKFFPLYYFVTVFCHDYPWFFIEETHTDERLKCNEEIWNEYKQNLLSQELRRLIRNRHDILINQIGHMIEKTDEYNQTVILMKDFEKHMTGQGYDDEVSAIFWGFKN